MKRSKVCPVCGKVHEHDFKDWRDIVKVCDCGIWIRIKSPIPEPPEEEKYGKGPKPPWTKKEWIHKPRNLNELLHDYSLIERWYKEMAEYYKWLYLCDKCGEKIDWIEWEYCPFCGAKIDKESRMEFTGIERITRTKDKIVIETKDSSWIVDRIS